MHSENYKVIVYGETFHSYNPFTTAVKPLGLEMTER